MEQPSSVWDLQELRNAIRHHVPRESRHALAQVSKQHRNDNSRASGKGLTKLLNQTMTPGIHHLRTKILAEADLPALRQSSSHMKKWVNSTFPSVGQDVAVGRAMKTGLGIVHDTYRHHKETEFREWSPAPSPSLVLTPSLSPLMPGYISPTISLYKQTVGDTEITFSYEKRHAEDDTPRMHVIVIISHTGATSNEGFYIYITFTPGAINFKCSIEPSVRRLESRRYTSAVRDSISKSARKWIKMFLVEIHPYKLFPNSNVATHLLDSWVRNNRPLEWSFSR